jgi:hypothetical protein
MPLGKTVVSIMLTTQGSDPEQLVSQLETAGVQDIRIVPSSGVVTGCIDRAALASLREIPGIVVELDETVYPLK